MAGKLSTVEGQTALVRDRTARVELDQGLEKMLKDVAARSVSSKSWFERGVEKSLDEPGRGRKMDETA